MKKIKFLAPAALAATIPAVVVPLTSCSQPVTYIWDGSTKAEDFVPYNDHYELSVVEVDEVIPTYQKQFRRLTDAVAKDFVYSLLQHSLEEGFPEFKAITVKASSFNKSSKRLTAKISVEFVEPFDAEWKWMKMEYEINKVAYDVDLEAHLSSEVVLAPAGFNGDILKDEKWSVKVTGTDAMGGTKSFTLDHNSSPELIKYITEDIQLYHFFCLEPYFFHDVSIVE